jgi:hypothetical protein
MVTIFLVNCVKSLTRRHPRQEGYENPSNMVVIIVCLYSDRIELGGCLIRSGFRLVVVGSVTRLRIRLGNELRVGRLEGFVIVWSAGSGSEVIGSPPARCLLLVSQ